MFKELEKFVDENRPIEKLIYGKSYNIGYEIVVRTSPEYDEIEQVMTTIYGGENNSEFGWYELDNESLDSLSKELKRLNDMSIENLVRFVNEEFDGIYLEVPENNITIDYELEK